MQITLTPDQIAEVLAQHGNGQGEPTDESLFPITDLFPTFSLAGAVKHIFNGELTLAAGEVRRFAFDVAGPRNVGSQFDFRMGGKSSHIGAVFQAGWGGACRLTTVDGKELTPWATVTGGVIGAYQVTSFFGRKQKKPPTIALVNGGETLVLEVRTKVAATHKMISYHTGAKA